VRFKPLKSLRSDIESSKAFDSDALSQAFEKLSEKLLLKEALYVTDAQNRHSKKRIKMIVPIVPESALLRFSAQIPPELIRSDIEVDFVGTRNGAYILDSFYEATLADAFCLDIGSRAETEAYAAVCVNSMSDSGVSALRARLSIPVVGPGQASFLLAAALGKRFSVITMWQRRDWIYEKLAHETGLQHALASIRNIDTRPDAQELLSGKEDFVFRKTRTCLPYCHRPGRRGHSDSGLDDNASVSFLPEGQDRGANPESWFGRLQALRNSSRPRADA
jgi:hypothetical protein